MNQKMPFNLPIVKPHFPSPKKDRKKLSLSNHYEKISTAEHPTNQ